MSIGILLVILAVLLFGLGAVVEGLFWLMAVAAIVLIAGIAMAIGVGRRVG